MKLRYSLFVFIFVLLCKSSAFSQAGEWTATDSLLAALKNAGQDTTRLNILFKLIDSSNEDDVWPKYNEEALSLSERLMESDDPLIRKKAKKGIADAMINKAFMYKLQGDIGRALEYNNKGLALQEEIGNWSGIAYCLNNMANLYNLQGDIPKALNYYERSMKIQEELGDKGGIAHVLNNIGAIYGAMGDYKNALANYIKCHKMMKEVGNKKGVGNALNNIGTCYHSENDTAQAMEYYLKSLKIRQEINDKRGVASSYTNIGTLFKNQGKFQEALIYSIKGLQIRKEESDKQGTAISYNCLGSIFYKQKKFREAKIYSDSSLLVARELGFPDNIKKAEEGLYMTDSALGNAYGAYTHYKQYIIYRDSINNETTRKATLKNQLKYEFEKKEAVMKEQQEKERIVTAEKNRFQQIVIASVILGLLLVIVFAAFVLRSLRTARNQKLIIEEKQREIVDSIHYAKRIQKSLLPTDKYIDKNLERLKKK